MVKQSRIWVVLAVGLALTPLAACGNDDDDDKSGKKKAVPVVGNFVGKVRGSDALVAVVTAPTSGKGRRQASVFVSDGMRVSEWFPGSVTGDRLRFTSDDGDAKVTGRLSRDSVTGTVQLPGGRPAPYTASRATGGSGLYDLMVASGGKLTGASASGVGLTGTVGSSRPGSGSLKLADGRSRKFRVTANSAGDPIRFRAGQLRLIVLPDGQLKGAGRSRSSEGGRAGFFVRSSAPSK